MTFYNFFVHPTALSCYAMVDFKTIKRRFRHPYRDIAISTLVKIAGVLKVNISELIEVKTMPEEDE